MPWCPISGPTRGSTSWMTPVRSQGSWATEERVSRARMRVDDLARAVAVIDDGGEGLPDAGEIGVDRRPASAGTRWRRPRWPPAAG